MTLQLPKFEQEILDESPLDEVVCQLRFNQILKIGAGPPAEFQEQIRSRFPVFAEERGIQLGVAGNQPFLAANEPTWQFKSVDENWTVSLTSSFVALKTTGYRDFEDFLVRLSPVVEGFQAIYEPEFYTRLGLRYVNRLVIPKKGDECVNWHELLNAELAGAFANPVLKNGIVETKHHLVLQTDDGQIGWRYSRDIGQTDGQAAERYILDFDHYATGQILCGDVARKLIIFNDAIYRLFRWCLTADGYRTLKPRPKPKGSAR